MTKKMRILAVITVVVACLLPYGSAFVAESCLKPELVERTCGGVESIRQMIYERYQNSLLGRETIDWIGVPEVGLDTERESVILGIFAAFFIGLGIFARERRKADPGLGSTPARLGKTVCNPCNALAIVFFCIGIVIGTMPFLQYIWSINSYYVVTNKRALIINGSSVDTLISFDAENFGPLEIDAYEEGKADVAFVTCTTTDGDRYLQGFRAVRGELSKLESILRHRLAEKERISVNRSSLSQS